MISYLKYEEMIKFPRTKSAYGRFSQVFAKVWMFLRMLEEMFVKDKRNNLHFYWLVKKQFILCLQKAWKNIVKLEKYFSKREIEQNANMQQWH